MNNIRVNYTNGTGKRTSTTINATIVNFYLSAVLEMNIPSRAKYLELVVPILNQFISDNDLHSKEAIEFALLVKIYEDGRQRGLILF